MHSVQPDPTRQHHAGASHAAGGVQRAAQLPEDDSPQLL